jgi:hypothetical protein
MRVHHFSPSWAALIQSTHSHSISLSYILITYSDLHLGLPSGFVLQVFLEKLYMQVSLTCVTCPIHYTLLCLIIQIIFGTEYNV